MPSLRHPAHPEHDQGAPAAVVFGVSEPTPPEISPVPLHLVADFPADFLARVEAGDWHLYAFDFDSDSVYALAMWIDNPNGEDFPLFVVNAPFLTGDKTIRAALRWLVVDALSNAEHPRYRRLPVDVEALATAQRAEWHIDVSDNSFAELAARAEYGLDDLAMWQACAAADDFAAAAESGVLL